MNIKTLSIFDNANHLTCQEEPNKNMISVFKHGAPPMVYVDNKRLMWETRRTNRTHVFKAYIVEGIL